MLVIYPDMQPIRFYRISETPDFQTYFPNPYNITHRFEWIPGLKPSEYYTDWLINKQINLQFRISLEGTEDLLLYKYNETTESYELHATVSPVNITPADWQQEKVNKYSYTPTSSGVYYFESVSAGRRSDKFVVHSDYKYRRRLIQIAYYNYENDYSIVYWDGGSQLYSGLAYFTGSLYPDSPGNDMSVFETDRGNIEKLRSTPQNIWSLKLADIHISEINRINLILSNSELTINGVTFQNEEAIEVEQITDSDLVNITAKLTQTNYNYTS